LGELPRDRGVIPVDVGAVDDSKKPSGIGASVGAPMVIVRVNNVMP
jgi:hypothetical protein